MGVTYFLLLSCLGLVITAQAQDCSAPLAGPNMGLKGNDILLQTFPDGSQVTFVCDSGYTSAGGSPVITCTAGIWSPVRLKCEVKNCGSAGNVENGYIEYPAGTEFGHTSVVYCNIGFRLVGNNMLRCEDQGWTGRLPVCEVVKCNPPALVMNGEFSPEKEEYGYREVVQYSCQDDYTLNGPESASCSEDETFQPGPPTCTRVQCEDPEIADADWVEGSRPPYRYKSTVTFRCRAGFAMKGEATQLCEINSQWSPGLPRCEKIMAPTTKAPTTTTTTTAKTQSHSTKKPSVGPVPTSPPGNNGNNVGLAFGIAAGVIILIVIIFLGCHYCGVLAFFKEKQRSRRGCPDKVAATEEGVALS